MQLLWPPSSLDLHLLVLVWNQISSTYADWLARRTSGYFGFHWHHWYIYGLGTLSDGVVIHSLRVGSWRSLDIMPLLLAGSINVTVTGFSGCGKCWGICTSVPFWVLGAACGLLAISAEMGRIVEAQCTLPIISNMRLSSFVSRLGWCRGSQISLWPDVSDLP